MDVSTVSAQQMPAPNASASLASPVPSSGGEGILGLLKDSVEIQGDMALQLIQSGLQTQFVEDKMAIAQQIIDVYA